VERRRALIIEPTEVFITQNNKTTMIFLQIGAGSPAATLFLFGGMIIVMYFFMLRPQMKKQKEQQSFSDTVQKGKDVVTASGIIGKVNKIEGQIVTLQIANNTFIRVTKNSISKEMTEAFETSIKDDSSNAA
jgi:preprotein translocase subunit YajC